MGGRRHTDEHSALRDGLAGLGVGEDKSLPLLLLARFVAKSVRDTNTACRMNTVAQLVQTRARGGHGSGSRAPGEGERAVRCSDFAIGGSPWRKLRQDSLQRDWESMKPVSALYSLDWADENTCLINSAANGLVNCIISDVSHRAPGVSATAVLGVNCRRASAQGGSKGYREVNVSFANGHTCIDDSISNGTSECSRISSGATLPDRAREDDDPESDNSLYIRPAIWGGIQPYSKPVARSSLSASISAFVKSNFSTEEKWRDLQDVQAESPDSDQDFSRHSILSDSMSVISGASTFLGTYKTPDVSAHGYDWSLHGVDSMKCNTEKTVELLQNELLTAFVEAKRCGSVKVVASPVVQSTRGTRSLRRFMPGCLTPKI